jgi:hypothetical protein
VSDDKKNVGNWICDDVTKVFKLALVIDDYKQKKVPELWIESEEQAKAKIEGFNPEDMFHEEKKRDPVRRLIFYFRYYTPLSNRKEKVAVH